jgi:hypothetical protein
VALARQGAAERKSGFAEMIDTDDVQKRIDLLHSLTFLLRSPQSEARLLTPPHMLMFGSIATPQ